MAVKQSHTTARGVVSWFLLLIPFLLIISLKFVKQEVLWNPETSTTTKKTKKCYGTPQERRSLAELEANGVVATTEEDWRDMAECTRQRYGNLYGHYVQHISKSAGTSICVEFLRSNECGGDTRYNGYINSNGCWDNELNQDPRWIRKSSYDVKIQPNIEDWLLFDPKWLIYHKNVTCQDIVTDMVQKRNTTTYIQKRLSMPENYIPHNGICTRELLNSIIVRHPIQRLASHYNHILSKCHTSNKNKENPNDRSGEERCNQAFLKQTNASRHYNVPFVLETLDIISDNYLTRTLNGKYVYIEPFGIQQRNDDKNQNHYYEIAMQQLRNFDWVMIQESTYDPQQDAQYETETQLIWQTGMGMPKPLGRHAVEPMSKGVKEFMQQQNGLYNRKLPFIENDLQRLKQVNAMDLQLFQEAKRLHQLDIISLQKFQQYGESLLPTKRNNNIPCCGNICSWR